MSSRPFRPQPTRVPSHTSPRDFIWPDQRSALHLGLTLLYNRVHTPGAHDADLRELRDLHEELDYRVAEAYGWGDLELGHGFHPVRGQGIRFTFSPEATIEVLYRLLELNKTRYEEEVAAGLHTGKKSKTQPSTSDDESTLF